MVDQPSSGLAENQSAFEDKTRLAADIKTETVGLIVVHGIGEQKPGDHLEGSLKPLANAINADGHIVTIRCRDEEAARSAPDATLTVHPKDEGRQLVQIDVREVYWADINEESSLGKGIRFWLWGLSAWLIPKQLPNTTPTYKATLTTPKFADQEQHSWRTRRLRLPLLLVGWIFALLAPVIVAADFIAKRVFNTQLPAGLTTLVNYVSAVKLYSQPRRHGPGMLESAVEPPRYAIRRRMIEAIADTAAGQYDRWYVVAHSQGTVVAFNGLMASTPALTAYLDDGRLEGLEGNGMAGKHRPDLDGPEPEQLFADATFRPTIAAHRIAAGADAYTNVWREKLFGHFKGFISYGSPLDKFAAIWPPTVSINRQVKAFPDDARWINVYDPTDPVSARLDAYDAKTVFDGSEDGRHVIETDTGSKAFEPENIAYASGPFLLLSHIQYLKSQSGNPGSLTSALGRWLMGSPLDPKDLNGLDKAAEQRRNTLTLIQIVAVILFFSIASTAFVGYLINMRYPASIDLSAITTYALGALISIGLVLLASAIGWLTTEIDVAERRTFKQQTLAAYWIGKIKQRMLDRRQG